MEINDLFEDQSKVIEIFKAKLEDKDQIKYLIGVIKSCEKLDRRVLIQIFVLFRDNFVRKVTKFSSVKEVKELIDISTRQQGLTKADLSGRLIEALKTIRQKVHNYNSDLESQSSQINSTVNLLNSNLNSTENNKFISFDEEPVTSANCDNQTMSDEATKATAELSSKMTELINSVSSMSMRIVALESKRDDDEDIINNCNNIGVNDQGISSSNNCNRRGVRYDLETNILSDRSPKSSAAKTKRRKVRRSKKSSNKIIYSETSSSEKKVRRSKKSSKKRIYSETSSSEESTTSSGSGRHTHFSKSYMVSKKAHPWIIYSLSLNNSKLLPINALVTSEVENYILQFIQDNNTKKHSARVGAYLTFLVEVSALRGLNKYTSSSLDTTVHNTINTIDLWLSQSKSNVVDRIENLINSNIFRHGNPISRTSFTPRNEVSKSQTKSKEYVRWCGVYNQNKQCSSDCGWSHICKNCWKEKGEKAHHQPINCPHKRK